MVFNASALQRAMPGRAIAELTVAGLGGESGLLLYRQQRFTRSLMNVPSVTMIKKALTLVLAYAVARAASDFVRAQAVVACKPQFGSLPAANWDISKNKSV